MNITRRAFLVTTSAFTTINLFHPMASAEIDADSLNRNHWYAVWYQPMDMEARKIGKFNGLESYNLPANTFLTLDRDDWEKIRAAKPGQGLARMQTRTTHYVQAPEGSWG